MSANRGKNTGPELRLRRGLWEAGLRGYRLHPNKVPGCPDVAFIGRKVAIFVHGCYWHRCPKCDYPLPKNNTEYWRKKFSKTQERDQRWLRELHAAGWQVLLIWECELEDKLEALIEEVRKQLGADAIQS